MIMIYKSKEIFFFLIQKEDILVHPKWASPISTVCEIIQYNVQGYPLKSQLLHCFIFFCLLNLTCFAQPLQTFATTQSTFKSLERNGDTLTTNMISVNLRRWLVGSEFVVERYGAFFICREPPLVLFHRRGKGCTCTFCNVQVGKRFMRECTQ